MHIYCCCVCTVFIFRPEYSAQYKYYTHLPFIFPPEYSVQYKYNTMLLLCLCYIHIPAGIFRPIQIQYTSTVHFPAGIFRQIQIQYTFIAVVFVLHLFSGRNIPSNTNTIHRCCYCVISISGRNIRFNTNTIHIFCCCVCIVNVFRPAYSVEYKYNRCLLFMSAFRPEFSVQYKYNTHVLLLCLYCINFPAGIFRRMKIQYTFIAVVCVLYLFSGRNIPSNTNAIHCCCCVCVISIFRPEYSVQYKYNTHLPFIFRPEYSVKHKYNARVLLLCLYCIYFPAGIFRQIQIQYTVVVVFVLYPFSGRNIPSNINAMHNCYSLSGRNIPSNTNTMHSCCCVVAIFRPEYSVKCKYNTLLLLLCLYCIHSPAGKFRPEYSVKYKYNTYLMLLCLYCIYFPAGIFRQIQIQYTVISFRRNSILYLLCSSDPPEFRSEFRSESRSEFRSEFR